MRLVYELPVDAIQRTLQKRPDSSMEKLLGEAIDSIDRRLNGVGVFSRFEAASFAVDLRGKTPLEIATTRTVIESVGSLSLRMVARADDERADLQLEAERKQLERWLEKGGRKQLQQDPSAIHSYQSAHPEKVRWVPHKIRQSKGLWSLRLSESHLPENTAIAMFSNADWNGGKVPAGMQNNEDAYLLELVAINMHEAAFTERDLDPDHVQITEFGRSFGVGYRIRGDRASDYADWSARHVGHASAMIWNGELVSAPIFVTKVVTGNGIITGSFSKVQASSIAKILRSGALPVKPKFIKQEALPPRAGK